MMAFRRVAVALTSQTKVQARMIPRTKGKGKDQQGKGKELLLILYSQPQKHPMKKDMAMHGSQTIGLPAPGLTIPGLQMLGGFAQRLKNCMDGGNSIESCQPSNTRGSGPWLHTVDRIESDNRKIREARMVLWCYDGLLPL